MKKISLTGRAGAGKFVLVDDEDFEALSAIKWHFNKGYAANTRIEKKEGGYETWKTIYMHRLIIDTPDDMATDHINHNGLDNRKENLRICTNRENTCNNRRIVGASGFRGVYKNRGKWQAMIMVKSKLIYIGIFDNIEDAARAWNEAAKKYHGEFSVLNAI